MLGWAVRGALAALEHGVEQGRLSRPARRIYRGVGLLAHEPEPDAVPEPREELP